MEIVRPVSLSESHSLYTVNRLCTAKSVSKDNPDFGFSIARWIRPLIAGAYILRYYAPVPLRLYSTRLVMVSWESHCWAYVAQLCKAATWCSVNTFVQAGWPGLFLNAVFSCKILSVTLFCFIGLVGTVLFTLLLPTLLIFVEDIPVQYRTQASLPSFLVLLCIERLSKYSTRFLLALQSACGVFFILCWYLGKAGGSESCCRCVWVGDQNTFISVGDTTFKTQQVLNIFKEKIFGVKLNKSSNFQNATVLKKKCWLGFIEFDVHLEHAKCRPAKFHWVLKVIFSLGLFFFLSV